MVHGWEDVKVAPLLPHQPCLTSPEFCMQYVILHCRAEGDCFWLKSSFFFLTEVKPFSISMYHSALIVEYLGRKYTQTTPWTSQKTLSINFFVQNVRLNFLSLVAPYVSMSYCLFRYRSLWKVTSWKSVWNLLKPW